MTAKTLSFMALNKQDWSYWSNNRGRTLSPFPALASLCQKVTADRVTSPKPSGQLPEQRASKLTARCYVHNNSNTARSCRYSIFPCWDGTGDVTGWLSNAEWAGPRPPSALMPAASTNERGEVEHKGRGCRKAWNTWKATAGQLCTQQEEVFVQQKVVEGVIMCTPTTLIHTHTLPCIVESTVIWRSALTYKKSTMSLTVPVLLMQLYNISI